MLKNQNLPDRSDKTLLSPLPIATLVAAIGICLGIFPTVDFKTYQLNFATAAYADDFNEDTIARYARAAFQIERERLQSYNRISNITGTPPSFTCYQPASFNSLAPQARNMAAEFCRRSTRIVLNNGLSIEKFNEITRRRKSDPNLERRIQRAITQL